MVARITPPLDLPNRLAPELVFAKVAELGSFRRAALLLGMRAATVAGMVRALERHRGRPLLVRTGAALAVSTHGAELLRALQGDSPVGAVTPAAGAVQCRIRVAVCPTMSRMLLQALPHFASGHPFVDVRVYSAELAAATRLDTFDGVLRLGDRVAAVPDAAVLGTCRIVTCASPGYLAERGTPASPDALAGHRAIPSGLDTAGEVRPLQFRDGAATRECALDYVVVAADLGTQLAAAVAGLGIAQLPLTREVRGQLAQRRLVPVLENYEPDGYPILLGTRAGAPPEFGAFRAWLFDLYRSEGLVLSPRR
jgi:LysR family transcriptional regulator for bpeEF and oprC